MTKNVGIWGKLANITSNNIDQSILDIVDNIKNNCVEVNEYSAGAGLTILHLACMVGNRGIVKALLDGGANPNVLTNHHETPLMYAAANAHLEVVNELLDKESHTGNRYFQGFLGVQSRCEWRGNSLFYAIAPDSNVISNKVKNKEERLTRTRIFKKISSCSESLYGTTERQETLFHAAGMYGNIDILQYLIDELKSDKDFKNFINKASTYGHRALELAAFYGQSKAVELLSDAGAVFGGIPSD